MWSPEFDKHIIFSVSLCCHFVLGPFSTTSLKDVVFEINVFTQNSPQVAKSNNVIFVIKKKYHNHIFVLSILLWGSQTTCSRKRCPSSLGAACCVRQRCSGVPGATFCTPKPIAAQAGSAPPCNEQVHSELKKNCLKSLRLCAPTERSANNLPENMVWYHTLFWIASPCSTVNRAMNRFILR